MTEIVILSGKGGTGKTSLVGSLAAMAEKKVLVDCDVDAADLHLLLKPEVTQSYDFICDVKAEIQQDKCSGCGLCVEYCRFDAISEDRDGLFHVDPIACEGCGVCFHFCPDEAVALKDNLSGQWFISKTTFGPMVHARLGIAQGNSGRLVALLRKEAREIAKNDGSDLILVDGPPGIGCPVIASITGATYVVIVTEPTLSALHDVERLLSLTTHFELPVGIVINKADINPEIAEKTRQLAVQKDALVLGEIAYDEAVTKAQVAGLPLVEYTDGGCARQMREIWSRIEATVLSLPHNERPAAPQAQPVTDTHRRS